MIRNITLSAEETLIQKARHKASEEHKTLNILFRNWLSRYVGRKNNGAEYERIMSKLNHVSPGKRFTREELNER